MRSPSQIPQLGTMPAMSPTQASAAQVTAIQQQAAAGMAAEIFVRAAADAIADGADLDLEQFRKIGRAVRAAAEAFFQEG